DADIQKVYDENKEELQGQALEQVKPQIIEYLKGEKAGGRREAFIKELKDKYKASVSMRPPTVQVATAGRPERGSPKAPITIIEFSDYQCPFCKRGEESIEKVVQAYGDKVRIVFRDYP